MMLQQEQADDYVVATGQTHSVREFVEAAFGLVGLDWREHVAVDTRYLRPTEVDLLLGDADKACRKLGWRPKVDFQGLVQMMVTHDWALAKEERVLAKHRLTETQGPAA